MSENLNQEPRGVLPPVEDLEERVLGGSEVARAASRFLVAVSRAGRSFLLYDPENAAIRGFLDAVRVASEQVFALADVLPLVVRPFEITLGPEVVYSEEDRERSLAFRLYRDGVRRLVFRPGVTWDEILKLLEVVSIRYTGIRMSEDDMVVLLWKAGFQHIDVEAIEGIVEDEDEGPVANRSLGHTVSAPADFDLPLPALPEDGPEPAWREIPAEQREAAGRDDGSAAIPALCVRLASELVAGNADPRTRIPLAEARHLFTELRDFLMADGTLDQLISLVRVFTTAELVSPDDARVRDELLAGLLDARGMARLVRLLLADPDRLFGDVVAVLDATPGNHLPALLAALRDHPDERDRKVIRRMIERQLPEARPFLLQQLGAADDVIAAQLVRLFGYADPDHAVEAVAAVEARTDFDVQTEAIYLISRAARSAFGERMLTRYAVSPHSEIRRRALDLLRQHAPKTAAPFIRDRLARGEVGDREEAARAGEALATCDPAMAMELFRAWTAKPRFFQYQPPHQPLLLWAAVAGLGWIPTADAEALIREVERRSEDPDVIQHCVRAMVTRRRRGRGAAQ